MMQASRAPVFLLCLPHNSVVLTEFLLEDEGDGWWHCPSPLRCKVLDGPASRAGETGRFWLVETDPVIEWHGDPQYPWGPDHPLLHPIEPTSYALVMATGRPPPFPDRGVLDGGVPVGPVLPSPRPTTVAEARAITGLWIKAMIKTPGQGES
jgi:hypothetical protein